MKFEQIKNWFDVRKTLIFIILLLLVVVLNNRLKASIKDSLSEKREELSESLALLDSNLEVQETDIESFKAMKESQSKTENWTDSVAPLVAEQKLILRQVRPMGIEQRGKSREEKLFLQVEGNVEGILGFLHYLASQADAIYVSRYLVTTRSIGTGFVTVEFVLSRLIL